MMQVDLTGKIAVVIGGTGSIGQAISIGLIKSGATVIVASRSKPVPGSKSMLDFENNEKISYLPVDVLLESSVKNLADIIIDKYGKVDILILAQGLQKRKPFNILSMEEWNSIIGTNLTGTFLACKYFTESMINKNYGKIIGITSLTAEFGIRNISAYSASKGGMSQFLKTVSIELAEHNINVNMIVPGRIKTRMTEDLIQDKNLKEANLRCIPMGRFGLPSDLTGAVLFLTSEASNYITGQTIIIDGGWLASGGNPIG
jgi:NAD(P)-dependent dehydrogenase (short-subunit alcohol dehydrogenase family)